MLCVAFHVTTVGVGLTATPARARIKLAARAKVTVALQHTSSQVKIRAVLLSGPSPPYHSPEKSKMPLNLGDVFPNFTVDTTEGRLTFHDFLGDRCSCCTSSDLASVRYFAGDLMGKGRGVTFCSKRS